MGKQIATLLVDDEPGCIDILRYYLTIHCPRINIVDSVNTAEEAIGLLNTQPIDLMFLDVHLFDANIFDLMPNLNALNTEKIFVTAYEQYALKALRVSALDYLLKPLEISEINRCYEKIIGCFDYERPISKNIEKAPVDWKPVNITLRQGDQIYVVHPENIILLQAKGMYTTVFFEYQHKLKSVLISKLINVISKQWDFPDLMRVHRSYAVNMKKVRGIKKDGTGLNLEIEGINLVPVAKRRIGYFLGQYNL